MNTLLSDLECMTEADLCKILGIGDQTARNWRSKGEGPAYIKAGNAILYHKATVARWLKSREGSNGEQRPRRRSRRTAEAFASSDAR